MDTKMNKQQLLAALQTTEEQPLSLDELIISVRDLLILIAPVQTKYKVSEAPDGRTIRYYVSQGLMSKPLNYTGGRANYDNGHVLTLLFIKKWQAAHFSLRQIKQKLETIRNKSQHAQDFRERLVRSLIDEEDSARLKLSKKSLPTRLLSGSSSTDMQVEEKSTSTEPDVQKTVKYKISTECTVYVSEAALQTDSSKVVMALRNLADQLDKQSR